MGYNGRDCILRALCESKQYFQKTKMGMMGEMLRVIFRLVFHYFKHNQQFFILFKFIVYPNNVCLHEN